MMAGEMRMAAAAKSLGEPYRPVEKGATGKEKTFQQNRNFGPGAMKPYPFSKPPPLEKLKSSGRVGSGVYYGRGPSKTQAV